MKQNSKIKLVVGIGDFRIGGAQKLVVDILNRINKDDFDVHLIVCVDSGNQETFLDKVPGNVSVHQLSFQGFKDIRSLYSLLKLLKRLSPDIVWSNLYFANTIFRILKLFVGYKVVSIEQNTYLSKTFFQKIVDFLLALITFKIVAVSKYVAEFTARQELISIKKFHVIYNGVDVLKLASEAAVTNRTEVLNELGLENHHKLVLNVGQFIYQKNQKLLIDSFALFSKEYPDHRLVILGDGAKRNELEKQIKELLLEKKVLLPGIKKDVARYFASSDFFVLTSRFEGFPLVVVEALACGLPVISTRVSGSSDYLRDGQNGYLVNDAEQSIYDSMRKIANLEASQRIEFKKISQELALQFDIKKITESYEELFRSALR